MLYENSVWDFFNYLNSLNGKRYRLGYLQGGKFESWEEYYSYYPEAKKTDRTGGVLSYFETYRIPEEDEIREIVIPNDPISGVLLEQGLPMEEISVAVTYFEGCGGVNCNELYLIRPIGILLFAATNIDQTLKSLKGLGAKVDWDNKCKNIYDSYREEEISLPGKKIPPSYSVVVPLAITIEPFGHKKGSERSEFVNEINPGHSQVLTHFSFDKEVQNDFKNIGPLINPFCLFGANKNWYQNVHPIDLGNLYKINRRWAMGSCPHMFGLGAEAQYLGELFSRCDISNIQEEVLIPSGIKLIFIKEMEEEETWIEFVKKNGYKILESKLLYNGDEVSFYVEEGDSIVICGKYHSFSYVYFPFGEPLHKNEIIGEVLVGNY